MEIIIKETVKDLTLSQTVTVTADLFHLKTTFFTKSTQILKSNDFDPKTLTETYCLYNKTIPHPQTVMITTLLSNT